MFDPFTGAGFLRDPSRSNVFNMRATSDAETAAWIDHLVYDLRLTNIENLYWDDGIDRFGHWRTQTFIAGLRIDELSAPWVLDGPMNRVAFDASIETQLAPTLQPGDVVIADNLWSRKSAHAQKLL